MIKNCRIKLYRLPLPCIAQDNDNNFFIIAKANKDKVLIWSNSENQTKLCSDADIYDMWNKKIFLLKPFKTDNKNVKLSIKWFLPTILKYKYPLIDVLIASLTLQILGLVSPMIMQVVIDKVLVHNSFTTLDIMAIALIIVSIFELIMSIAKNYVFTESTNKIDVILGSRLFAHLLELPLRYFETRRVGDTVARVRELDNIRSFLTGTPLSSLLDFIFISVYIIIMLFYSKNLSYIVIFSIPIFAILSFVSTPLFRSRIDERFFTGAESQSYLVEVISGINTVKSLAIESKVKSRWEDLLAKYTNAGFKETILVGNINAIAQFLQKIFDLSILWLGAHYVIDGNLTVGQLIAFRMLASRVSNPVLRLVQLWQEIQQASIAIKKVGDIFDVKSEVDLDKVKTSLPTIRGNIYFQRVSFRYNLNEAEVIKDISFKIPAGVTLGVVGRSGSGKSTLAKLIQRLYTPQSGKILIDGTDISMVNSEWLRRQIGVVLQESFLFNMSIRENISINSPNSNIEQIVNACKIAGAHNFILEFPEGYDTIVGEKGTNLSGGQKQRIAIARAIIHNPRILIFDEATSALDYESENIIQSNLKQICKGRTVIIIAHRLSTLRDADLILSMDKGNIVEYGTPKQLLEQKGLYYYLFTKQNGKKIDN